MIEMEAKTHKELLRESRMLGVQMSYRGDKSV